MTSFTSLRHLFPIFQNANSDPNWIYFDSAATSQKPSQVIETINQYYCAENANVHRASHHLAAKTTGKFEQARANVQKFVNARHAHEIIWTKGATESINLVANALQKSVFKAGDRILLSQSEHHANIVPWIEVAKECELHIDVIPLNSSGALDLDKGLELITPDTTLLSIGHVSNALGNVNPLQPLLAKARANNALTLIDGCQAAAHLSIDVQELDCDFYVFSGHKMFAPTGIGALYGKTKLLEQLQPYQFGGEMIEKVSFQNVSYQHPPFKFEAGTPNISGVLGMNSAVSFIQDNRQKIAEIETQLHQYLVKKISAIPGIKLFGDQSSSIATLSFTVDGINNQDLGFLLNEQQIAVRVGHHCAMPLMQALGVDGTIRVSLACYNEIDEVDRFVIALKLAMEKLSTGVLSDVNCTHSMPDSKPDTPLAEKVKTARGWDNIYRQVMLAGKQQGILSEEQRIPDNEVFGCESQVWIKLSLSDEKFKANYYSPSKIVRGLLAVMLEPVQNADLKEVEQYDNRTYFASLGLDRHLSQSRGNGLNAVMDKIRQLLSQYRLSKKSN